MQYKVIIGRILFYISQVGKRKKGISGIANFEGRDTYLNRILP